MVSGRPSVAQASGHQGGFAYVLLLIVVAVLGATSAATVSLGATMTRRDAEQQLLAIGAEFEQALRSYANHATAAAPRGPRNLEDLLKDPRTPGLRRHLRKLYDDPLTGKAEWGIERDAQGGIVAVFSMAQGRPIKRSGFVGRWVEFENADSYQDWHFGTTLKKKPEHPSR